MPSLEVLAVLADEVAEVVDGMSAALGDLDTSSNAERLRETLDFFSEQTERIETAAGLLGLAGLKDICARVKDNVARLEGADGSHEALAVFMRGPNLMLDYLRSPKNPQTHAALKDYLADSHWPQSITDEEAEVLIAGLADIDESPAEAEFVSQRATRARPEDVALEAAPDVNPLLVESFLTEGPLQAGAYTSLVEQVIRGGAGVEVLNEARRLVHTVKGAANTVGVRGIAMLTHHLEDLLEYLTERALRPEGAVAKLLMDGADCLEMMFESLLAGEAPPAQAQTVLQRLLDTANAIDRGEDIMAAMADSGEAAPITQAAVSPPMAPESPVPAAEAVAKPEAPAARAEVTPKVRVAAATIEEMLRLSGEMTIGRAHIQERLHQTFGLASELRERHAALQNRANELDHIVTVQGVAAGQKHGAGPGADSSIFDALELDQYSELHGAVHGFVETLADLQALESRMLDTLSALDTAVTQEGLVNTELHEHVMRARMVPAAAIEPRLARTVRQACDATAKRAALAFTGGDVMLDDHVVNDLVNPLSHLLRNAVDHGLEDPGTRAMIGKPEAGEIVLSFVREGNHIVIRCRDDGAGLDLPRIRATAMERGLIPHDAALADHETARLILLPGFSTRASVSEVSGRGVGMDVVHSAVQKLKGTIDIASEPGKGCTFTLRLPMTMGTAHCLVVRAGGELAAIPTDLLDRAVYQGAHNVERQGERYLYREDRESLEVHDLAHLLGLVGERSLGDAEDARSIIVVNDGGAKKAVAVDALLSGRDLVIKNLGRYLAGARGVIGASLLGDGRVLPVLDLHSLLRLQGAETQTIRPYLVHSRAAAQMAHTVADILVVDDSLTVRQTLQLLLAGEGYEVHTAKDGVEALEYVAKKLPSALLVDLEMPRMNGLELTSRLRAAEHTRGLPVIMVTSRSSEKHREQARIAGVDSYLTKPYRDEDLLGQLRSMLSKAAA
jgi:chemosensory pili system protein ChpA (sensor histidine kinase/response regulator)